MSPRRVKAGPTVEASDAEGKAWEAAGAASAASAPPSGAWYAKRIEYGDGVVAYVSHSDALGQSGAASYATLEECQADVDARNAG